MEDTYMAEYGVLVSDKSHPDVPYELFAVFDGHCGRNTAGFLQKHLEAFIKVTLRKLPTLDDLHIWNGLKEACVRCDHMAKLTAARNNDPVSGSMAIIGLRIAGGLWIACVGDSRAILRRGDGTVEQLSEDASLDTDKYRQSVEKRGGCIERIKDVLRVNGLLAVARSFGDSSLFHLPKTSPLLLTDYSELPTMHYHMSARPKIVKVDDIKPGDILILCSDGVTDVASSQQIGEYVASRFGTGPAAIATDLVAAAVQAGSHDDCTAMVIPFVECEVPLPFSNLYK
jgi:serine/threonine protein phosphatase PrpC